MTHAAAALARAIRRRPDRYELRLDFEHDLYSVANIDRDSLDLDFLSGKYLAEQDPGAGAFDFEDLITHTRAEVAQVASFRNAAGNLEYAAIGAPRKQHYPAPRILSVESDDFDYVDQAAAEASGWIPEGGTQATGWYFDAATKEWVVENGGDLHLYQSWAGLEIGAKYQLVVNITERTTGSLVAAIGSQLAAGSVATTATGVVVLHTFTATATSENFGIITRFGWLGRVGLIALRKVSHADGENVGYLCEPARENLFTHFNELDNAAWTKGGVTVTPNTSTFVDGTLTMDAVVEDSANTLKRISMTKPRVAGKPYVVSAYGKVDASKRYVALLDFTTVKGKSFDLLTGEVLTMPGGVPAPEDWGVEYWGDGNYRVWIVNTAPTTGSYMAACYAVNADNTAYTYLGDGVSRTIVGGMQLEEGREPSMPIPTTTAAVTRAADSGLGLSDAANDLVMNAGGGITIVAEVSPTAHGGQIVGLYNQSDDSLRARLILDNSAKARLWSLLPTAEFTDSPTSIELNQRNRIAATVKAGRQAIAANGGAVASKTNGWIPGERFYLETFQQSHPMILHSLRVIPRALTDAELIAEAAA